LDRLPARYPTLAALRIEVMQPALSLSAGRAPASRAADLRAFHVIRRMAGPIAA